MERWCFNIELFDCLPDMFDTTVAKLAKRSGICQQTLNRYMLHEIRVSVQTIMSLCNALRMPVRYFVCKNEMVIPERENASIPADIFREIVWDLEAVERTFGDGPDKIFWKDAAAAMNVTSQKSHKRFRLETRFPMDDFLLACTNLQISPFKFLVDTNGTGAKVQKSVARRTTASTRENEAVLKEVAAIRQEMETVKAKIDILAKRFDDLLAAHNTFAHRIGIAFNGVSDSNINIAAESDAEYGKTKRTQED